MTACLPASPALSTLELLAGRVVPVPFDGPLWWKGRFVPPQYHPQMLKDHAEVHGTLAAGLKKQKLKLKPANRRQKYSIATN